jgi:hypothetical protein
MPPVRAGRFPLGEVSNTSLPPHLIYSKEFTRERSSLLFASSVHNTTFSRTSDANLVEFSQH